MHIKRWLLLLLVGVVILGLGAAIFIRDLYRTNAADEIAIVYWLTGAWLEPEVRAGAGGSARACADRHRHVGPHALGRVALRRPQRERPRGAVHEALPGARPEDRGDRRRDRPLDAAARPEGLQRQYHGRRDRRRRRWQQRAVAPAARDHPARRHSKLHRRPRRCRAADDPAHAVPLPAGLRARRPRLRQPVHRRDDRRDRRLRGGGARVEPRARGARPGAAGHERPAEPLGTARLRAAR